jgi:hypothetical protein
MLTYTETEIFDIVKRNIETNEEKLKKDLITFHFYTEEEFRSSVSQLIGKNLIKRNQNSILVISNPIIKRFDGDIIITDPCYIDKGDVFKEGRTLWDSNELNIYTGEGLENFGFTNYIWEGTIYGDWGCTTLNKENNSVLGYFCADAGLVGVFLLKEVLSFNPKVEELSSSRLATIIKDFHGTVEYKIEKDQKGTSFCYLEGNGNVNFITDQTSA